MPKKAPTLSGDRHQAALVLYQAKWTDPKIGRALLVCVHTVFHWRRDRGLPPNFKTASIEFGLAHELYLRGESDGDIARQLGVTQSGVTRWRQRNNLARNCDQVPATPAETRRRAKALLLARQASSVVSDALQISRQTIMRMRSEIGADPRLLRSHEYSVRFRRPRYSSGRPVPDLGLVKRRAAFIAYADGLGDREIAERVAVDRSRIVAWRRCYGLASNRPHGGPAARKQKHSANGPAISPFNDPLYARIARAVGNQLAPDVAADIVSDIYVAVQAGELPESEIERQARKYGNRFIGLFASAFGPPSLDEEIGEGGVSLYELYPDVRAASEMRMVELILLARLKGIDVEAVLAAD